MCYGVVDVFAFVQSVLHICLHLVLDVFSPIFVEVVFVMHYVEVLEVVCSGHHYYVGEC